MLIRWGWLCPWLAILLAAGVLVAFGLTWWSALLAALFLVCPALLLWGLYVTRPLPDEADAPTDGMLMDWTAPFYDIYCSAIGLGEGFRAQTLRVAAIQPGEKVLDVGCGTGVLTRMAAESAGKAGSAMGIDPGADMIRVAREKARRTVNAAEFKVAAVEQLPFAEAQFDVVLASLMLHHLPPATRRAGLAEVHRVLKPGGRLVVADFQQPTNLAWWLVLWPFLMMPSVADNLRGLLPNQIREAGFSRIEIRGYRAGLITFLTAVKSPQIGG